ncbi:unnamed protein product [Rhizoctonia solani]|uniref:RecA family profile 2 domain-containing protein n=1 Tax=Rhizoctonia solani TaxID=456999 RepID=A0A8H3AL29_9AGAM|nr:unnamed protein product [Rhizoctonia solani]
MPVPTHDESRPSTPPPDGIGFDEPQWDMIDELQSHGINAQDITKLKARLVHHHVSYSLTVLATERRHMRRVCRAHDLAQEPAQDQDADHTITITSGLGLVVPDRGAVVGQAEAYAADQQRKQVGGRNAGRSVHESEYIRSVRRVSLPPEMGGASGKVTYIDTEGTFRPDRIRAIAEWFGVDAEQALENITYACAYNSEHQMELIQEVEIQFAEGKKFRLLLAYMLAKLCKLPEEFNIVVLLTNQVQADPGAKMAFALIVKPVGGHILSHASATRIMLRKGHGEERVAKLVDSPDRSESEGSY